MTTTPDSLSVVLPVHNDAAALPHRVADLLDCLSDLTASFEVLILDNGSTDATEEVAHDLARHFPQLRLLRQSARQTSEKVRELSLENTTGELVVFLEEKAHIPPNRLRQLWDRRETHESRVDTRESTASQGALGSQVWTLDAGL